MIGTSCAGGCGPKDWKAAIDGQMHEQVPDGPSVHDEPLPGNGRIRWGTADDHATVYAAWFDEGATEYRDCTVYLGSPQLFPALDAFVEACRSAELAPS
jgi:hypothetical protein